MAGQKRQQVTGMHWKIKSAVPEEQVEKNRQKKLSSKAKYYLFTFSNQSIHKYLSKSAGGRREETIV